MIAPVLQTLAEKYADKIVVVKVSSALFCDPWKMYSNGCCCLYFKQVDVDENEELAMKFEVSSMPTFIFLKNGNKVDGFSGANADKLEKIILDRTN